MPSPGVPDKMAWKGRRLLGLLLLLQPSLLEAQTASSSSAVMSDDVKDLSAEVGVNGGLSGKEVAFGAVETTTTAALEETTAAAPAREETSRKIAKTMTMTTTAQTVGYDCDTGLERWEQEWSMDQKTWCWTHEQKGFSRPFDCEAGLVAWEKSWTEDKKTWCWTHEHKGGVTPFDCDKDLDSWETSWEPKKKAWCWIHEHKGYREAFNCDAGIERWQDEWTQEKQKWCCQKEKKGCVLPAGEYDCDVGFESWKTEWSTDQKMFCCKQENKACYDCDAGIVNWIRGWSPSKKQWCCENEQKGCYDCHGADEAAVTWTEQHRSYCCHYENVGCYECSGNPLEFPAEKQDWCCKVMDRCPVLLTTYTGSTTNCPDAIDKDSPEYCNTPMGTWTPEKKDFCCKKYKRGCPDIMFDCDAGRRNWLKGWSDSKKQWCCQRYRVGCPPRYECESTPPHTWTKEKSTWCCHKFHVGCEPYDCYSAEDRRWWTGPKKDYCCRHHGMDCCDAPCHFGGEAHTCKARIQYAASVRFKGMKHACVSAQKLVEGECGQCKHECGCQSHYIPPPCEKEASMDGVTGTCGHHIRFRGQSLVKEKGSGACAAAHHDVLAKNSQCAECTLADALCDYTKVATCKLWGDPHIISFDRTRFVFYSTGDFQLMKSENFNIQGRFQVTRWTAEHDKTDYSSMTSIIVGGKVMHGKTLEVHSGAILCSGKAILQGFGTAKCGVANIQYNADIQLIDEAMGFLPHKVVKAVFPGGVFLTVNRWPNFINAMITTREDLGPREGICGNFDGIRDGGWGEATHDRWGRGVSPSEDLFQPPIAYSAPTKMPSPDRCPPLQHNKRMVGECQVKAQRDEYWSIAECLGDACDVLIAAKGGHRADQDSIFDFMCDSNHMKDWSLPERRWCCLKGKCEDEHGHEIHSDYDCNEGFRRWEITWSHHKKKWCCENANRGCEPRGYEGSRTYNCQEGLANFENAWSETQKSWCCANENKGCQTDLEPHFNCNAALGNFEQAWSPQKKTWCCKHESKGCTASHGPWVTSGSWESIEGSGPTAKPSPAAAAYDCNAALGNWESAWSAAKKRWCWSNQGKGYRVDFNCNLDLSNWENAWTDTKKTWCWQHEKKGAATLFDCNSQLGEFATAWSAPKKAWCCSKQGKGCGGSSAFPALPDMQYDCNAALGNFQVAWSVQKKDWCCKYQHKGCSRRLLPVRRDGESEAQIFQ